MAKIGVRKGHKIKLSISIDKDNVDWIESQLKTQKYRSTSHLIDVLIHEKKANEAFLG